MPKTFHPPRNLPLKTAIVQSGRTQRSLARTIGIPEGRMTFIVTGRSIPTKRERGRLAALLNVPESILFADGAA